MRGKVDKHQKLDKTFYGSVPIVSGETKVV